MLDSRKRIVEVMQKLFPALILNRLPKPDSVILERAGITSRIASSKTIVMDSTHGSVLAPSTA